MNQIYGRWPRSKPLPVMVWVSINYIGQIVTSWPSYWQKKFIKIMFFSSYAIDPSVAKHVSIMLIKFIQNFKMFVCLPKKSFRQYYFIQQQNFLTLNQTDIEYTTLSLPFWYVCIFTTFLKYTYYDA